MSATSTIVGTPQKRLNFDIPEELANEFKAYAALQGKTQRELVLAFMRRCIKRNHQLDSPNMNDFRMTGAEFEGPNE